MTRPFVLTLGLLVSCSSQAAAQSPRTANPERPTVATHAYAMAPGYLELEQGVRVQGTGKFSGQTSWEFNLKIGVERRLQLALFGTGFAHTRAGNGVGDLGAAVKLRSALSPTAAIALVPAVTVPTGSESRGLGAGRVLGSLVCVLSAELGDGFHADLNAGPVGVGAGRPQWFGTASFSKGLERWGLTWELFGYGRGGAGAAQGGLLGAVTLRLAKWAVVDGGGVRGLGPESPDQLFLGLTTNMGRIFK